MKLSQCSIMQALLFILLAASAEAFWRMPCRSRSGLARIDPLVSNGSISDHAHAIHGSDGFSITAGYDALVGGSCTSCEVSEDKSAYWTPALYFQHAATGDYELVEQVGGMLAYYLLYPNSGNSSLSAFPEGFEMISGDTNQRNFTYPVPDIQKSDWNVAPYNTQAFLRQAALGFNCLNYAIMPEGSLYRHFLPDKAYLDANCLDGVRFELMFPSCWNGVDKTSPDKKSHVAFPSEVMTGNCPDGFPIRLPSLFYETIWNTYAFAGVAGQFMIANGDPTGYGYHGDFIMGWDGAFLQEAVNTCTNLSGQITDCPLFTIQDASIYENCNVTLPSAIENENVVGPASTLPGNPDIAPGPAPADQATAGEAATTGPNVAPTLSYSAGVSLASSDTYVPDAIFVVSTPAVNTTAPSMSSALALSTTSSSWSSSVPASSVSAAEHVEITSAPTITASTTESFFSTEYSTSGQALIEVLWIEEVKTVTESATTTIYDRRRHLHRHKARKAGAARV